MVALVVQVRCTRHHTVLVVGHSRDQVVADLRTALVVGPRTDQVADRRTGQVVAGRRNVLAVRHKARSVAGRVSRLAVGSPDNPDWVADVARRAAVEEDSLLVVAGRANVCLVEAGPDCSSLDLP
jgi:hypothetical protein